MAKVRPWVVSLTLLQRRGEISGAPLDALPVYVWWKAIQEVENEWGTITPNNVLSQTEVQRCLRISPIGCRMVIFIQIGFFCFFVLRSTRQIKNALGDSSCQGRVNS